MNKLFVFNPGHEEALKIPLQQTYTPSKEILKLRHDLSPLMLYFAKEGDYIWQWAKDSQEDRVLNHKGELVKDTKNLPKLEVSLWALEGHCLKELKKRAEKLSLSLSTPKISKSYLKLSHRSSSVLMLKQLNERWQDCSEQIPYWLYPQGEWESMQKELSALLKEKEEQGIKNLLIKRAYTSSGRGISSLSLPCDKKSQDQLLLQIRRCKGISLEEKLELIQDWAIEYHINTDGEVKFVALSKFKTNSFGAYQLNILADQSELYQELYELLGDDLSKLIEEQKAFLKEHLAKSYEGYIGVDMFVYKSKEGRLRLNPCVEINLRSTMGLVAHLVYEQELKELVDKPYKTISFHVDYLRSSWEELKESFDGDIKLLTPLKDNSSFIAFLHLKQ